MRFGNRLGLLAAAAICAGLSATSFAQSVEAGITAWQAQDYPAAIREWRPLADAGNADAQYNLAQAYKLGRGVPLNMTLAEQWYERAARQGHEQAGANLGLIMFQNGRRQEAMPYIQRAAERGDPRAQYVLGTALFNGDLVARDWPRAYALMSRAAATGLPPAVSQLAEMERHITAADRARGTELARNMASAPSELASAEPPPPRPSPRGNPRITGTQLPPSTATGAPPPRVRPAPAPPAPSPAPPVTRPAPPAPAPAAAGGRWRVQLGAFSSDANARRAWAAVSGRLPGLGPVYVRAGNLVRLQAGPLASRAAADRACAAVRGAACFPVAP